MESGWITAVAICIPIINAVTTDPRPTIVDRDALLRNSGGELCAEPQALDTKNAIEETTAQPIMTGAGIQGTPTKGNTKAKKAIVPTLKAGAMRRARIPRMRMANAVAKPGSSNKSTAVRITGNDCHQDTETPLSEISQYKRAAIRDA